jgi:very-long-chain (3R)-3-hydroxyacyl-CoA dehydratase
MSATSAAAASPAVKVKKPVSPIVTAYLLAYNLLAAASWAYVLYLIVQHLALRGKSIATLYDAIHMPLYFAQSLAILEIFHSLFGLVSSPVVTTMMQVYSRLQLVWGIFFLVPESRVHMGFVLAATVRQ